MIRTSVEGPRGCGTRKPGGLYLVAPDLSEPCPRLPFPLTSCPHCGAGIKAARGWTWITPSVILPATPHGSLGHTASCPLGRPPMRDDGLSKTTPAPDGLISVEEYHRMGERAGLIWIGERFYPDATDFMKEAHQMGVSRRIQRVPRGFNLGETYVVLAHRKAIDHSHVLDLFGPTPEPAIPSTSRTISAPNDGPVLYWDGERYTPGAITLFKPTAIEYIVKGTETDEEIEVIEKRGLFPVKVVPA